MITELGIFELIVIIIAVEAVTEIIGSSELFQPVREMVFWYAPNTRLCKYCLSVWVASFFILFYSPLIMMLAYIFMVHRLSNVFHEGASRWFKKKPIVGVFTIHHNNLNQDSHLTK